MLSHDLGNSSLPSIPYKVEAILSQARSLPQYPCYFHPDSSILLLSCLLLP